MGAPESILAVYGRAPPREAHESWARVRHHLHKFLETVPGIEEIERLDEDGRPDFRVVFRGTGRLIECKNVLRKPPKAGIAKVDFQRTRAAKGNPCSRYYQRGDFDVLAACMHPIVEKWVFRFAATTALLNHPTCEGRISSNVVVSPTWSEAADDVLASLL